MFFFVKANHKGYHNMFPKAFCFVSQLHLRRVELLGRITEFVYFVPFPKAVLVRIVRKELFDLEKLVCNVLSCNLLKMISSSC